MLKYLGGGSKRLQLTLRCIRKIPVGNGRRDGRTDGPTRETERVESSISCRIRVVDMRMFTTKREISCLLEIFHKEMMGQENPTDSHLPPSTPLKESNPIGSFFGQVLPSC